LRHLGQTTIVLLVKMLHYINLPFFLFYISTPGANHLPPQTGHLANGISCIPFNFRKLAATSGSRIPLHRWIDCTKQP
jgi:hypothetical protein